VCGIAGAVTRAPDGRAAALARRLTAALAHRGPDGDGLVGLRPGDARPAGGAEQAATIALGHRRLSIVDLAGGAQPLANEDGTVWVSFNGEIYNQLELRRELEASGHRFRTRADTEVLVHGWEEWGTALFGRLNGIFAFALADTRRGEVLLVRDPLGVKPLYVGTRHDLTWFASELRAATEAGASTPDVSVDALKLFLTFRFIPSPWAVHEDAWKVPPSHYVRLTPDRAGQAPTFESYASSIESSAQPKSRLEWREAIGTELRRAVQRQLMADVPVGVLLSGGVDSGVVARLMRETAGDAPQAFAIGFSDAGDGGELPAARQAAAEIGVPLDALETDVARYRAAWPAALAHLGEPVANPGQLLVSLLCERVSRTHKVVLTGQGADEPLGGYPRHMAERLWRLGRLAPGLSSRAARGLLGGDAGERLTRVLKQRDRVDRFAEIFAVVTPEAVDTLVRGGSGSARELARAAVGRWLDAAGSSDDAMNVLLRVDARLSLPDDLLLVADHFSMRSSVELRVPFLDLAFVELVERMPSRYKLSAFGERKWLYREAASRILPRETAARLCGWRARLGRKAGFSTPAEAIARSLDGAELARGRERLADAIDWSAARRAAAQGPRQTGALGVLALWSQHAA
jgi:asparagine synthase (glutamine-hydrolysing)